MPSLRKLAPGGVAGVTALLGLAALVTACQSVQQRVSCDFTPVIESRQIPQLALVPAVPGTMTPIPLNSVSMTDPEITNTVLVQYTGAQRSPTGTVEVTTRMVNCTDYPMIVEGRTHFFDAGQRPVEPVSAWQRVHLPPRALGTYIESSTDAQRVQTYLTELRGAR